MTTIKVTFEMHGLKALEALKDYGLTYVSKTEVSYSETRLVRVEATWILETADKEQAWAEVMDCIDIAILEENNIDIVG